MKKSLEVRKHDANLSLQEESRRVEGRAIVFETPSNDLGGFVEIIHRSAISQELLDKSDVFARTNHSDDYIMARSNKGKGSLSLELREDGVYYSFEAPNTEKGNELLEHLRRGEISQSSFAFAIAKEKGSEEWEKKDGVLYRHINKISVLGDVAPVFTPAYEETSVCLRCLELASNLNNFGDFAPISTEEKELRSGDAEDEKEENNDSNADVSSNSDSHDSKPEEDEVKESPEEEKKHEDNEERATEKASEDKPQDEDEKPSDSKADEEAPAEAEEDKKNDKEQRNNKKDNSGKTKKIMEQRFSILSAVNAIANNKQMDELSSAVVAEGAAEMRKAGLSYGGQIQLPTQELRAAITVAGEGEDTVATELFNVMEPLRAKNVLVAAGAKFITGLTGDVQIPLMSASNVTWEAETASASDGAGTFSSIKFSPKRLTAYIDVSKQFLIQDSVGAEAMIRQDIVNAINSKLEATILGSAAGSATQPAGIFNGKTVTKITDFAGICNLEAGIEDANINGECKYVMSNKCKAVLRNMAKSSKSTELVMQNGSVDGTSVLNTSNVQNKNMVYGDWSQYCICSWGGVDLTVDPYTLAKDGKVRLVINAFFDAKPLRDAAFVCATTDSTATAY